jgi:hypothetical protein
VGARGNFDYPAKRSSTSNMEKSNHGTFWARTIKGRENKLRSQACDETGNAICVGNGF